MRDKTKARLQTFGFEKQIQRVNNNLCPFCSKPIKLEDFTDIRSKKEFELSGMCQACQNKIFE